MRNIILLIIFLSSISFSIFGQTRTIKGIAIDKGGNPILGCNVFIKGTTTGTITDPCGEFELRTNENTFTVMFSCLTSDLRTFESVIKTDDFNEGDKVIFHLRGHWSMKNRDCKRRISKKLRKYIIE
ncbi:MAG: carboxypeptidase-like regulatory domain-containing protein [Chryseotalea sp.]|jgi:hypothetical protein